jgi:hypothetical protein
MRVIPSKLVPTGKQPMGVKNFSEVEVEVVKLLPNHANSTQEYKPNGVNRMQFRIPSYTNSFMDNSRSFLSFKFQIKDQVNVDATNVLKMCDVPGSWIQRLTIKSSNGLVLEDISNYNILKKVLTLMETEEESKIDEGNYSAVTIPANRLAIGALQSTAPKSYVFKFNTGILSQSLSSYLPLHIMDNGSFAFDIELYLAPAADCLMKINTDQAVEPETYTNVLLGGNYVITEPTFNLCLVKVDQSIIKKYNQIAADEAERVVIPYITYHNHQTAVTSSTQTVFISDNCTDLRRVYSVFHEHVNDMNERNVAPWSFLGSAREDDDAKLTSYNFKLGNKHIYNEDVVETDNNNVSLNHFVNAHYKGAKPCCPAMYISKLNRLDNNFGTNYESKKSFVLCPNFTYSEEAAKGVIQGVSAGGLPITATYKFAAQPNLTNNCFVECGYDLVIQNGQLSYVEHRLDGEYSY